MGIVASRMDVFQWFPSSGGVKFWNFRVSPTQSQLAGDAIDNRWKENEL